MSEHPDKPERSGPDRRDFLQTASLVGAGLALSGAAVQAQDTPRPGKLTDTGPDRIPRKFFGSTKEKVSVIGLGGYSLGDAPTRWEHCVERDRPDVVA